MVMKKWYRYLCSAMLLVAVSIGLSTVAWGSGEPAPGKCESLGALTTYCYYCEPGHEKYLGKVAVLAEYDEIHKTCAKFTTAKNACENAFGDSNIGFYTVYWLGLFEKTAIFDKRCVNKVGKQ